MRYRKKLIFIAELFPFFVLNVPAIGLCDASLLPELPHGRKVPVKNFRGSVYKYVCDGDYKRVGQGQVHCAGGVWDLLHPPVCASKSMTSGTYSTHLSVQVSL